MTTKKSATFKRGWERATDRLFICPECNGVFELSPKIKTPAKFKIGSRVKRIVDGQLGIVKKCWRQKDWERNSIQMLAQAHFSHKQLHGKNGPGMHEMLHGKGVNWAKLDNKWKNGVVIYKDGRKTMERHELIFAKEKNFVEQYLVNGE
jgi:hypothetical protein